MTRAELEIEIQARTNGIRTGIEHDLTSSDGFTKCIFSFWNLKRHLFLNSSTGNVRRESQYIEDAVCFLVIAVALWNDNRYKHCSLPNKRRDFSA